MNTQCVIKENKYCILYLKENKVGQVRTRDCGINTIIAVCSVKLRVVYLVYTFNHFQFSCIFVDYKLHSAVPNFYNLLIYITDLTLSFYYNQPIGHVSTFIILILKRQNIIYLFVLS